MTNYLLAGGGTAGHVNPLLALAEYIRKVEPDSKVIALGTAEGLESRLVPERGFRIEYVERLPFPRKLSTYAVSFPQRYLRAVKSITSLILAEKIDVVVGFGGYASAPAYDAARRTNTPLVIHEANALPGLANRRGASRANAVAVSFPNTPIKNSVLTGTPLRAEIERLLSDSDKAEARKHFGLKTDVPTLLVTGGSLGAKKLNDAVVSALDEIRGKKIQVLHIVGGRSDLEPISEQNYVRLSYCDRMDLAIDAADLALSRAGASTVSEFSAVGLPAIYVPYAVGNGEQEKNATSVATAGGALIIQDRDFGAHDVEETVIPLLENREKLAHMARATLSTAASGGTQRLFDLIKSVLKP